MPKSVFARFRGAVWNSLQNRLSWIIISRYMNPKSPFPEFLAKKTYEISYAVFRISSRLKEGLELGRALEANATRLLEAAVKGDTAAATETARVLEYLLRLGGDTGVLYPGHVSLVIGELAGLEAAIAEHEFNLQMDIQSAIHNINQSASQSAIADYTQENKEDNEENDPEYAEKRRETILQFILQSGPAGCRFKDIFDNLQGRFREMGERTIRYDLQHLIERGIIEKYGPGGAYTYYRTRSVT